LTCDWRMTNDDERLCGGMKEKYGGRGLDIALQCRRDHAATMAQTSVHRDLLEILHYFIIDARLSAKRGMG
jgi:hypothetical protein